MAPPLRRGRALVRQRLAGLLLLIVLGALVAVAVGTYAKAFSPVVRVVLESDRIGNQLTAGADVKARGILVGSVRGASSTADGARLELALDPVQAARLPSDTRAQLLHKTLFGEKYVALVFDDASPAAPLRPGSVIPQDRSQTARETSKALDSLLPLLQTLEPERLSATLNALSSALRGRGERLGRNAVLVRDYLAALNPQLPVLERDFAGLADLADTLTLATPDVAAVLDDLAFVDRSLVESRRELSSFLRTTAGTSSSARSLLADNENRFITLAADSLPTLQVFQRYSPQYPCLLDAINRQLPLGAAFGGLQPGLHITLQVTQDQGGYRPGDQPVYGEDAGPTCFGLVGPPIRPFPVTVEPKDGYCDDQERQPGIQTKCDRGSGAAPPGVGPIAPGAAAAPTPYAPASFDRQAVGAVVGPVMGVAGQDVPDVAVLLFGPIARGTQARVS